MGITDKQLRSESAPAPSGIHVGVKTKISKKMNEFFYRVCRLRQSKVILKANTQGSMIAVLAYTRSADRIRHQSHVNAVKLRVLPDLAVDYVQLCRRPYRIIGFH